MLKTRTNIRQNVLFVLESKTEILRKNTIAVWSEGTVKVISTW